MVNFFSSKRVGGLLFIKTGAWRLTLCKTNPPKASNWPTDEEYLAIERRDMHKTLAIAILWPLMIIAGIAIGLASLPYLESLVLRLLS